MLNLIAARNPDVFIDRAEAQASDSSEIHSTKNLTDLSGFLVNRVFKLATRCRTSGNLLTLKSH